MRRSAPLKTFSSSAGDGVAYLNVINMYLAPLSSDISENSDEIHSPIFSPSIIDTASGIAAALPAVQPGLVTALITIKSSITRRLFSSLNLATIPLSLLSISAGSSMQNTFFTGLISAGLKKYAPFSLFSV